MRTYRALAERLRRELGVAPSRATRELVERLRAADAGAPDAPAWPPASQGCCRSSAATRSSPSSSATWRAVAAGAGAAAVIRGEAGIGKTRLATELRRGRAPRRR